jgi:hypothetical protein
MKTLVTLALIFTITFVLFDAVAASAVVIAAALLALVPSKVWKQIGRAAIDMAPYLLFVSMLDNN